MHNDNRIAGCIKIALTGFMGVGKSSVARHLASLTGGRRLDLDEVIERKQSQTIERIIESNGIEHYRVIESNHLRDVLTNNSPEILSLGGGTWTIAANRELIKSAGYLTVWLEASFDHCWRNISRSRKKRPLASNRTEAAKLFEERKSLYCLADCHIIIRPGSSSYDVARQIIEEVLC